ncbi:hypothetical protein, partial [Campylobacter ureolyticus]
AKFIIFYLKNNKTLFFIIYFYKQQPKHSIVELYSFYKSKGDKMIFINLEANDISLIKELFMEEEVYSDIAA